MWGIPVDSTCIERNIVKIVGGGGGGGVGPNVWSLLRPLAE